MYVVIDTAICTPFCDPSLKLWCISSHWSYTNTSSLYSHNVMFKRTKHMRGDKYIEELFFEAERGIWPGESASSL
jgi:hypothetical protein